MKSFLAVLPYKTPAFNKAWVDRVFDGCRISYLFLGFPGTSIDFRPDDEFPSIRQAGDPVNLRMPRVVYLPASCERQHTLLTKLSRSRFSDFVAREWDVVTQYLEDRLARGRHCVNPPFAARRGANKMLQLRLANRIGLLLPPTVVSNDPLSPALVLPAGTNRGICKPLGESGSVTSDIMAPTSFFTESDLAEDPDSVRTSPACYQRYVPAEIELRSYVFQSNIRSVAIRPRRKQEVPDLSCQDLQTSDFSFTNAFRSHEKKLVELVKSFGLEYAAIDSLVVRGKCHFLEINPSGGWGWLPVDLQRPLDQEFRRIVLKST